MPCHARKTPYLVEKHGDGKKNVSKPGISIIKCISMRKRTLLGNQNFVSGDLFTGASRHKATWEKIQLGALMELVRRICLNNKTFQFGDHFLYSHHLYV